MSKKTIEEVKQELQVLQSQGGQPKEQADRFRQVLQSIVANNQDKDSPGFFEEAIKSYVDSVVNENVSLVISRQLLSEVTSVVTTSSNNQLSKSLSHYILERVQPRVVSFEEQIVAIRQHLSSIYEEEGLWREAANVLSGIPLETGQRQYSNDFKLKTYLKIARLYLEDDDPIQAEASINRATLLQGSKQQSSSSSSSSSNDNDNREELQIMYMFCYARVLDYRRKFIEAASRYNELSFKTCVEEGERLQSLHNSLICTVLASAGQQRSRMLATLFKDERCQQLTSFGILQKMYLDRVIKRKELQDFTALLQPHQKVLHYCSC